ncbi:MAG TPA: hypothetical protein VGL65_05560 [Gemmatimonadales bacterium]|jgi:hypothetical protein
MTLDLIGNEERPQLIRRRPARPSYLLAAVVLATIVAGCSKGERPTANRPPIERTVTAAQLDALPRLVVTDGRLVCQSNGTSPCPIGMAIANWLDDGKFATWELHRQVQIWSPGITDPVALGENGTGDNKYNYVVSAGATPGGYQVIDASPPHVLLFDRSAKFLSSRPIPPVELTRAVAFSGPVTFMQLVRSSAGDSAAPATFEVRRIDSPGDTLGLSAIKVPLPWLLMKRVRANQDSVSSPVPLFALLPPFAFTSDSDVVWSIGDRFAIKRQAPDGTLRWSIASEVTGPPVGPDEINQLRTQFLARATAQARASFDSNAAHTGTFHPAIAGLLASPDGRLLVVGPQTISRDTVTLYTVDATGLPTGQFGLPRAAHALLFAGDSVLVQRAGANSQPELHWLVLRRH